MRVKDKDRRGFLNRLLGDPPSNLPALPENAPGKALVTCPSCTTVTRVPTDRGKLEVTCPHCSDQWLWSPERPTETEPRTQTKTRRPGERGGLPDRVHIPVRCAKTNGGGLVTFRLLAGNSVYRFHSAQKFEPGATTDKKPPDTGAVPTELIDWRGVACPCCKGPVLRRILCGACETIGCDAGYSIREGKPWSRCACGDSGFVGTVPYEKLQTSAPTPAGNVEAGASPLALEDGTARTYPAIGRFGGY